MLMFMFPYKIIVSGSMENIKNSAQVVAFVERTCSHRAEQLNNIIPNWIRGTLQE